VDLNGVLRWPYHAGDEILDSRPTWRFAHGATLRHIPCLSVEMQCPDIHTPHGRQLSSLTSVLPLKGRKGELAIDYLGNLV
jgi:hypothetical protein